MSFISFSDMKKILLLSAVVLVAACSGKQEVTPTSQWTPVQAQEWYDAQPWLSGCDYIPSSAINQIEMWSEATYDPKQIDKELGWAEELGFNTMRVFLSSVVYRNDPEGLKSRMDDFLGICNRHGIRPLFVFFDDCWDPESAYGPQRAPKPGVHNSGWVQDPSKDLRADTTALFPVLEAYIKDIVGTFRGDERILLWDLYNEPGNSGYEDSSIPLVKNVFRAVGELVDAVQAKKTGCPLERVHGAKNVIEQTRVVRGFLKLQQVWFDRFQMLFDGTGNA